MEHYLMSLVLLPIITITITLHFLKLLSLKLRNPKLPPGPKPWPIIGNIHQLGDKPHHSVTELSKIYGPIMSLKLGSITTIVISSPEIAREMFVKHDLAFANRQVLDAGRVGNHDKFSMILLPVGPKWRDLKKIAAIQLLTNQRLDASQGIRRKKVVELVEHVRACCEKGEAVDIAKAAFTTSLNLLTSTFFSMDLFSHDCLYSQELKELIWHMSEEGARPNVSDFFPLVKHLDLQGLRRRISGYFNKMLGIFEEIIDQRLRDPRGAEDDVLATLLKLVEENKLTLDDVKHLLMDLFGAGTETSSSTLEWAMTELLRNPEKMEKAQSEIDEVLGKDEQIQESDISKLPYIQAVVKETLRLHPPAPFLVPRKAEKDVELFGYLIPRNAQIWINVWSIGRDPSVWENANLFEPERFFGREIDVQGRDFELIPFGAGRRMCPGMPLAIRMMHLMLATLLHSFNWKHGNGVKAEDIDVDEKFGITLQKIQPLQAIPLPR